MTITNEGIPATKRSKGRPTMFDRPMTPSEREARRRAKIAVQMQEVVAEVRRSREAMEALSAQGLAALASLEPGPGVEAARTLSEQAFQAAANMMAGMETALVCNGKLRSISLT